MKFRGGVPIAFILILAGSLFAQTGPSGPPPTVDQSKKELGGIKKRIQEERQRVQDIAKKESSVISQLNTLDRNLVAKERELKDLKKKLGTVDQKVKKATQDLGSLTQNIEAQEALLLNRTVALYKFGDMEAPELLFSSRSYEDFLSTRRYLTTILEQDRKMIDDFRKKQAAVGNYHQQLMEDEQELRSVKRKAELKKGEIQKDLLRKGRLLEGVRQEKQVHLAAIRELEAASFQLQGLINRLEKELQEKAREKNFVPSGKKFTALRGKLPYPVKGKILSTFGRNENSKFNTFTVQKGIEIEAPLGAGIRAVHDGRVLYSDWFKGYGKILIIDHGDGYYTLSGHASSLLKTVGEDVHAGEVVALVGDTGSLKGPCLYFEIRQRGKPLDPLEWLAN
ncbi:MAG: peptidoglycan DD-metalloendopeptidase family protein [Syntrophaceae bacterium]|nr:peptidoglycan DD-metalloendopeptidase family protein [Syntrophaceae bacterium]